MFNLYFNKSYIVHTTANNCMNIKANIIKFEFLKLYN